MIPLPQSTRPLIKALAVAVFVASLAGCASKKATEPYPVRNYRQVLQDIKSGMSRGQLHAVQPPSSPPMVALPFSAGHPYLPREFEEHHALDNQQFVNVRYKPPRTGRQLDSSDLLNIGPAVTQLTSVENLQDTVVSISPLQRKS